MSGFDLHAEFFPLNEHDLDAVAALEASIQAFPWSRGNFADSLQAGHSVWVCRLGGDLIGFSVIMRVLVGVIKGRATALVCYATSWLMPSNMAPGNFFSKCARPTSALSSCIVILASTRLVCVAATTLLKLGVKTGWYLTRNSCEPES